MTDTLYINSELLGFIDEVQDVVKVNKNTLLRILLSIYQRGNKYVTVGISRLEAYRYDISERQMNNLISLLRDYGFMKIVGMRKVKTSKYKCNVYELCSYFFSILKSVPELLCKSLKKVFPKVDSMSPIDFMKTHFSYKEKRLKYQFEYEEIQYVIAKMGRFKGQIYDTYNNCIVTNYYSLIK